MFSRIRMSGGWFTGSTVSALEFEAIDAMRPSAIDGDGGGTYAPSALLSIGGLSTTLSASTLTLSAAAMAVSAPGTWTAAQTINGVNVILNATANIVFTPTRTVTRVCQTPMVATVTGTTQVSQIAITASNDGEQGLDLPHGASLVSVTTYITPPTDGTMPGTRPQLQIIKRAMSTGSETILATTTDPNSVLGDYEAYHGWTCTPASPEVIDRSAYKYYAKLTGESGANSTTITWHGCTYSETIGTVDLTT